MADPSFGYYRPWLEDVRRYRPYQLEDRVEQLFHEKSVTAHSAWNRLFDATIANLRFKVLGKSVAIEPTLSLLQDRSAAKRKAAAQALAATFKTNVQQFALITQGSTEVQNGATINVTVVRESSLTVSGVARSA